MDKNKMEENKDKKVKKEKNKIDTANGKSKSAGRPPQKRKAQDSAPQKRSQYGDGENSRRGASDQSEKRPPKKMRPSDNEQRPERTKKEEDERKRKKTSGKSKSKRKKKGEAPVIDKKDYGDEFYTDELEQKRKRAKLKAEKKLEPDIDIKKAPISHRRRKLKNVGVAVSIISCCLIIGVILSLTVFFRSETFEVEGEEHYSAQDIIDASGMTLGENLFLCDKGAGEEKIESELPYVEEAKISIKIPSTMVITVTESRPAFLFQNNGEYIVVSSQGKVLEKVTGSVDKYDASVVVGCTVKKADVGKEIKFKEKGVLAILKTIANALSDNEFSGIKEIDLSNTANVSLNYSNRIKIILGLPDEINYKVKVAKIIISDKLTETDRGILDVSGCKEKNKASYFKPDSSIYLDRIEATESLTQPTETATQPPTNTETQEPTEAVTDEMTNDYSSGVPSYEYPTDEYGNIIYPDSDNTYDYGDSGYDYSGDGGDSADNNDYNDYQFTPDDDIY